MSRGRPKQFIDISYGELGEWIGVKGRVKVSKAWFEHICPPDHIGDEEYHNEPEVELEEAQEPQESEHKIEYTLTNFDDE